MTKQELIQMVGSDEQANMVMELVLKNVKKAFVTTAIKTELEDVYNQIRGMMGRAVVMSNGSFTVNWGYAYKAYSGSAINAPAEEEAEYERRDKECRDADALLYKRNRLISMLAERACTSHQEVPHA